MNSRSPILSFLFDTLRNTNLSAQTLREVEQAINDILELTPTWELTIEECKKINQSFPELKLPIPKNIGINAQDAHGNTLLIIAACGGHTEIVQRLLEAKADSNISNQHTGTALSYATAYGYTEIVKHLITAKADVNFISPTLHHYSTWKTESPYAEITSNVYLHLFTNDRYRLEELLQRLPQIGPERHGRDVYRTDDASTLMVAVMNGYNDIVNLLITAKANVNYYKIFNTTHNEKTITALHLAAYNGHNEIIENLIQAKANINITSYDNYFRHTPLENALYNKRMSTVSLLLSHGAKIPHPLTFFNQLIKSDQKDLNVLICFKMLANQLHKELEEKPADHTTLRLLKKTKKHLASLIPSAISNQQERIRAVDEATQKALPPVLLNIVNQYDISLPAAAARFFKCPIDETTLSIDENTRSCSIM